MKKNLAIFASGSGTNAENIANFFRGSDEIAVKLILSNRPEAFVLERAKKLQIPSFVFTRVDFNESERVIHLLGQHQIDCIVLAGFLWLIPANLIKAFPNKIINLHPALLPKFGGKGMFGSKVHEAVIAAGEKFSGITIHLVNEKYDEGRILFQASCAVRDDDTPATLAARIHELEYTYLPRVLQDYLAKPN